MTYAERAYFDGDHCQQLADWIEDQRLRRIEREHARAHRDAMCREYLAKLNKEWPA